MVYDRECMKNQHLRMPLWSIMCLPCPQQIQMRKLGFLHGFCPRNPRQRTFVIDGLQDLSKSTAGLSVGQIANQVEIPVPAELLLFSFPFISASFATFAIILGKATARHTFPQPTAPPIMVHQAGISKQTPVARLLCGHHHHPEWRAACNCACWWIVIKLSDIQQGSEMICNMWEE